MEKISAPTDKNFATAALFACAAIFLFSIVTALVKFLSDDYSVFLISFYRNLFALIPAAAYIMLTRKRKTRPVQQIPVHIMRSVFGFCSMICLFYGYHLMPLAEATIIYYTGPICITILAALILKEQVRRSSLIAVALGFAGVFLMIRPDHAAFNAGVTFTLAGTLFYALAMVSLRQLGKTEDPFVMSFMFALIATVMNTAFLPWVWDIPASITDFVLLVSVGLLAVTAQTLMNVAYIKTTASSISPLIYTSLIWNTLFGFMIWGDVPTFAAIGGLAVILFANIVNKRKSL